MTAIRIKFWTPDKIQELLAANEEGLSARHLDARVGCSAGAASKRLRNLGVPLQHAIVYQAIVAAAHKRKAARKAGPTPPMATEVRKLPDEPPSLEITISDIRDGQCRLIAGDVQQGATFCGQPAVDGSWCAHHRARVYVPSKPYHRLEALHRAVR